MIRATFKSLAARKLRLLLSSLSIVLGVSFVAGAFVLTDSLGKVFDDLFSTVSRNVAVDVRGDKVTSDDQGDVRALLPQNLVDTVSERRRRQGGAGPGPGLGVFRIEASSHSSQLGRYQFQSPSSFIDAGRSTARTMVASSKTKPRARCRTA